MENRLTKLIMSSPAFIPIFLQLHLVRDCIMKYIDKAEDIENLCLAGGKEVRREIFRKQRLHRDNKTVEVLKKILVEEMFEKHSITIGNV